MIDILLRELCLLAIELERAGIPFFLGGGLGIYLRTQYLIGRGERTVRPLLEPRATSDIDVFLSADVICNVEAAQAIRSVLDGLGFNPVAGAENYQFTKDINLGWRSLPLKIDLLSQQPDDPDQQAKVKMDSRRIRAKGFKNLHAHVSPEALLLEVEPLRLSIPDCDVTLQIPNPLCLIMLKVAALRDQRDASERGFGRHHAFDIYLLMRSLTEEEWRTSQGLLKTYSDKDRMADFIGDVVGLFDDETSVGSLRLREHAREVRIDIDDYPIEDFLRDLHDFLGISEA